MKLALGACSIPARDSHAVHSLAFSVLMTKPSSTLMHEALRSSPRLPMRIRRSSFRTQTQEKDPPYHRCHSSIPIPGSEAWFSHVRFRALTGQCCACTPARISGRQPLSHTRIRGKMHILVCAVAVSVVGILYLHEFRWGFLLAAE